MFKKGMMKVFQIILFVMIIGFVISSCAVVRNPEKPAIENDQNITFFKTIDSLNLCIYDYKPSNDYKATIFIISGITGINHHNEQEIIEILSNNKNRVVIIHPRGTGYSDGKRGDMNQFSKLKEDYITIIKADQDYKLNSHPIILYGHSMSSAITISIADNIENVSGIIIINPPILLKNAKGMSPRWFEYFKYATYLVFAKHTPIVKMAGDPKWVENDEDRKESEQRLNDPLLVKYFSMYMMLESKKCMDSMLETSKKLNIPLLLLYGMEDSIVDKKGCDQLFSNWLSQNKKYECIEQGSHGKSTVILGRKLINDWIDQIN